ncbi:glycosyltransferase family 4 protein [Patescibacteria group bacterium]
MKNKKILLVTRPLSPPWDEASKNFAYNLAKNIKNFQLTILVSERNANISRNVRQEKIYTSNSFNLKQKHNLMKYLIRTRKDFDIVHYIFTPTKLNSFLIKYFAKHKNAKTIQTIATIREDLFSDKQLKKLIFGDVLATYSEYARKKLNNIGLDHVQHVYPGVDLDVYFPTQKNLKLMSEWKITPDDFIISYPGEYTRLGATNDIVKSIPKIFKAIQNSKFIFACRIKSEQDAQKKDEILHIFKSKGLLNRIIFTDIFLDMPKLYNMSDVVIFPVRNMKGKFDVPLAVIEAMACEKPVVISDLPILSEFANEKNSVKIKRGNRQGLIDAIVSLRANDKKRQEIGKNARQYVAKRFNIKKVSEKYQDIYEAI